MGWRWQGGVRETTSAIAVRVFGWAPVDAVSVALHAVAKLRVPAWPVSEALIYLAFADVTPPLGVALEDLDDNQELVIATLAELQAQTHELEPFGLWDAQFAAPFLAGMESLWPARGARPELGTAAVRA